MTDYNIGIEIEVRVVPHKIRSPLRQNYALYYEKLAAALRKRGLKAKANDLTTNSVRAPSNYQEWWITRDSSLGTPEDLIPFEAVSPVLQTRGNWVHEIDTFWAAMRAVFHQPQRSSLCGSHIHVSKGRGKNFTLEQLKIIAYGIVLHETLVIQLLMPCRQTHSYCKPNTQASTKLSGCNGDRRAIARLISGATSPEALRNIMQNNRYVLWNFDNVLAGKSGTIEFRGGRFLRGEVRTKRWIAFTVAFIHAMLTQNDLATPDYTGLASWDAKGLYAVVKEAGIALGMSAYLPHDYKILNETNL